MQPAGWVRTARGQNLNFDELVAKATRPLKQGGDQKDKITRAPGPAKTAVGVVGFMPDQGQAPARQEVDSSRIDQDAAPIRSDLSAPSSFTGSVAQSVADLTGIKIDKPIRLKKKTDPVAASNSALGEIMADLTNGVKARSGPEEDWRKGR